MAHGPLEAGVVAEAVEVVGGKGVAQDVLVPGAGAGMPAGGAAKGGPSAEPVRGADGGGCGMSGQGAEQAQEGRAHLDAAGAAGLAVLREDGDAAVSGIKGGPGQPRYLAGADAGA